MYMTLYSSSNVLIYWSTSTSVPCPHALPRKKYWDVNGQNNLTIYLADFLSNFRHNGSREL